MIRILEEKDIDSVVKIWYDASVIAHGFVSEKYWFQKRKDMRELYLPQSETYVLQENDQLVAFIALVGPYIAALFVSPPQQGKGYGQQLMDYIKENHSHLYLGVYSKNKKSIAFYLKQGFRIKEEQIEPNTGEQETIMEWIA